MAAYTPVVTNGGTATFSTITGWYYVTGDMVFFCAYLVTGTAGSGSSLLHVTSPTAVYRGTRQTVSLDRETSGGRVAGVATAFTTGSGAVWDRLTVGTGNNLEGSDLSAASIHTIQGWYRQA